MANQYKNKVVYGGNTLIDLTGDTVDAEHLLEGYTAHDATGAPITGIATTTGHEWTSGVYQDAAGYLRVSPLAAAGGAKMVGGYLVLESTMEGSGSSALQSKSVTPTENQQTITADSGYDGLSSVSVGAISSTYVGSGITRRDDTDLSASGATVTVPAGFYADQETKSVASGTEGTPTASKGTVSNHSVTVTPSVTNGAGYIPGGTHSGTPVTVSASELVSGSETKTANGTYDVTNLAEIVVNVSGSTGKNVQVNSNAVSVRNNGYTASTLTLTVAKSGTYNISWMAWRSSSQGTMGTNLHINSTSGTDQQTFTNTYGQHIQLSNQTLTEGDVLTIYATSGSTSRYIWVGNLIIEEV